MDNKHSIIAAAVMAAGLAASGLAVKSGIDNFTDRSRCITVKGLAEREVKADKVTWPIVTTDVGNNLQELYASVAAKTKTIVGFLHAGGLTDSEIAVSATEVNDRQAQNYASDGIAMRYNVKSVITVTSSQVDRVRRCMTRTDELLAKGVAVVKNYDNPVKYEFTGFKKVKPEMLDEAIAGAQSTAQRIAAVSGAKLGSVETASQGAFSIEDRDETTPYIKQLRVVSTVTYAIR